MSGRRRASRPPEVALATHVSNAFEGGVKGTLTSPSPVGLQRRGGKASYAGPPQIGFWNDVFPVTGSTTSLPLTLTYTPMPGSEHVYLIHNGIDDGIHQRRGVAWTRAAQSRTVNYTNRSLSPGDIVVVEYAYYKNQPPPARATQFISIRPNAIAAALEWDLPLNLVGGAGQNTLNDSTYPETYVRTSYSLDPGSFESAVATFPSTNVGDGWTLVACELSINARATSNPGILNGLSFDVAGDILGGNTYTPYYYYDLYVPDSTFQTRTFRWANSGGDALPSDAAVENGEIQILFGPFITVGGTEMIVDVNTIILTLYYIETSA